MSIGIITTASIPWLTGTSVNPLFMAVYLNKQGIKTSLYCPWISPSNQKNIFNMRFETADEQKKYIFDWVEKNTGIPLEVEFYDGIYFKSLGSILPLKNLAKIVKKHSVVLLKEPEHLTWACPFGTLKNKRSKIIGIIATNYWYYVKEKYGLFVADMVKKYNNYLIARNCDLSIGISKAIVPDKNYLVENINGVNIEYFKQTSGLNEQKGIYFIGKLMWQKGFREMINLLAGENYIETVDIYGEGYDKKAIAAMAEKKGLKFSFKGICWQPWDALIKYKVFINPSLSESSCTVTAEALAMNKWAIIPKHPSNEFFYKFKNCLTYESKEEFKNQLDKALSKMPAEDPAIKELSWEAATNRLIKILKENGIKL